MSLLAAPLASAEFLVVDTETNGLTGHDCELTEVGAVLVGGGECHEAWSSLVGVDRPLGRGIQRFTRITQAMVDAAPPPAVVLPALAARMRGRVLVAHSASFDARVLRHAFARAGLDWPAPPVLCTVAMARRYAPLAQRRGLAPLADALGIAVSETHRALPDAQTCAAVFCALFRRLCAQAATVEEAVALLGPRRRAARAPADVRRRPPHARPDVSSLPEDPGVYVFRDADARPLYVGKSVAVRSRVRSHFTTPGAWTGHAERVDYEPTCSELGALVLEDRLIKRLQPPGNVRGKKVADGMVYLRCRLDIAYPVLEVAREPAAGHAVTVGPVRGRVPAAELVEQLNSLFGLRHCGRRLPRRQHPSVYGQMGRCLSPCLGDLDPNLYRARLDAALAVFTGAADGRDALLCHVEAQMRAAAAGERFERAEWLRRRHERLAALLGRLGGVLRATHARPRLVLAPHPAKALWDALWLVGGRVCDVGPLPDSLDELQARTAEALRAAPAPGTGAWVHPDEVDELRIVTSWIAAHDPPALDLTACGADPDALAGFVAEVRSAAAAELPRTRRRTAGAAVGQATAA